MQTFLLQSLHVNARSENFCLSRNLNNLLRRPQISETKSLQAPSDSYKRKNWHVQCFCYFLNFFEGRGGMRELSLWTRAKRRSAALGIHYISQVWTPARVNDLWNWVRLLNIFSGLPPYSVNQNWAYKKANW